MNSLAATLCIIVSIATVHGTYNMNPDMKKAIIECKAKTGANDDDVHVALQCKTPVTEAAQCMTACFRKKTGYMTQDNKIVLGKVKELFTPLKANHTDIYDKYIKVVTDCKNEETPEKNECKAVKHYMDCVETKKKAMRIPEEF